MKRVQIYLEEEQYQRLRGMSKGKDMARLVRDAIDKVYPLKDQASFNKILDNVAGIWKNRTDINISRKGEKRNAYLDSVRIGK